MPGNLPKIKWERTKWVSNPSVDSDSKGKTSSAKKGSTEVVETPKRSKRSKKRTGYLDVFERAKKDKKPVLMYFTMDKCDACRTMEKLILRQKTVTDAAKKYHSVMLVKDFITKEIADTYKIRSAPSIVLTDYTGERFLRFSGRQSPRILTRQMKQFAAANAKAAKAAAKKADAKKTREKTAAGAKKKP